MEKMNEDEEKSINAAGLGGSDMSSSPPSLPDLVQETIVKMVDERKTLLTCRLVNTAWKKVADKTLEKQTISEWTKWKPFQQSRLDSSFLPRMEFITDWVEGNIMGMQWNHSALSLIGNPFPTNSMHMELEDKTGWPPYGFSSRYKSRRIHMMRELLSRYGHFLTCVSFSHFSTTFEVLNGMLSDMSNLKSLTLTIVKQEIENPQDDGIYYVEEEEEEEVSPWPNLPSLPNLTHLKICGCSSTIIQAIFNSYSSQITTLQTTEHNFIDTCPQPFTNLKQLKLASDMDYEPTLLLPQLGPSTFPSLQYFSYIQRCHTFIWEDVIRMVDSLPKTLVNLHLDLYVYLINEMNIQNLNKDMSTFPLLQKLGIHFPRNKILTEGIGMWLLPRFPNVDVLDLIRYPFQYDMGDDKEREEDDEGTINNVVNTVASGFWSKCSKLEKILVYRDVDLVRYEILRDLGRDTKL